MNQNLTESDVRESRAIQAIYRAIICLPVERQRRALEVCRYGLADTANAIERAMADLSFDERRRVLDWALDHLCAENSTI